MPADPAAELNSFAGILLVKMTSDEKRLYHQIHPVKLTTDVTTAFASTYLLWKQLLIHAILLAIVPSIVVSIVLINTVSLQRYKDSTFGRYLSKYMDSRIIDTVRFCGFFLMMIGGWYHLAWLISIGFAIIIVCWSRGLLFRKAQKPG